MKYQLLFCLSILSFNSANAQLGITASSMHNQANEWQVVPENFIVFQKADFLKFGVSGVVDYAFRLKNESVRLRPAFYIMHSNSIYYPYFFQVSLVGFQGSLEFALWGEQDKNGRTTPFRPFLQLSPGFAVASMRFDHPIDNEKGEFETNRSHILAPSLGASLFLEFKLSELLTVAPTIGVRVYPRLQWRDFTELVTEGAMVGTYDRTNWVQYNFGIRVSLNFPKRK